MQSLSSTIVLPRIAAQPGVSKKRTSKGQRYLGVGISKPSNLRPHQKRAQRCRDEFSLEELLNDMF